MISWDSLMLETLDKHARAIVCDKAMSINPNDIAFKEPFRHISEQLYQKRWNDLR